MRQKKIGIFDSGFGGLTVFKEIERLLPEYDYIYLGDNSRAPYGNKSFDTVYNYTWQCVKWLIENGCQLIILACNTASARALRKIQKENLKLFPSVRVLGVIIPTAEVIGQFSEKNHIGIVGTEGTIKSETYLLEIEKFFPNLRIFQKACPLWVPIIESNNMSNHGVDEIINKDVSELLNMSPNIDVILLACTHYPLLIDKIEMIVNKEIKIISQGEIVAKSLKKYLEKHVEIEKVISKKSQKIFYTTDDPKSFEQLGSIFYGQNISAYHTNLKDN